MGASVSTALICEIRRIEAEKAKSKPREVVFRTDSNELKTIATSISGWLEKNNATLVPDSEIQIEGRTFRFWVIDRPDDRPVEAVAA